MPRETKKVRQTSIILPVLNIFQRFGNVARCFAAVGLEEAEEVLGDVFDSAELLLPLVDVHLDSLQESGREMLLKMGVARMRVDSFRKYGLRPSTA